MTTPSNIEFFTGSRRGIFLHPQLVQKLIETLTAVEAELPHGEVASRVLEVRERLQTATSAYLSKEIVHLLKAHPDLTERTKARAIRMVLGNLVAS